MWFSFVSWPSTHTQSHMSNVEVQCQGLEKMADADNAVSALQKLSDKLLTCIAQAEQVKSDDQTLRKALIEKAKDLKLECVNTLDAAGLAKKKLHIFWALCES